MINKLGDDNRKDEIVDIVDKWKYEQAVRECKKWQCFIFKVVGRNITVLSEQ